MKPVTASDLRHLADQLERTARILRSRGDEAVRRARDWATPLRATGTDPGRGKGNISDPTANAATSEYRDPNADQLVLLSSEAGRCFDAVTTLESRVSNIAADNVTVNERAGIGWCACPDCTRYCDGTASNRLRNLICPACWIREHRKEVKQSECDHKRSSFWSKGRLSCMDCHAVIETASAR